jgi:hypothetical protein
VITSQEVLRYVRAEPFRPFRILMKNQRTFDVWQPRMVKVGKDSLHVFTFVEETPGLVDDWDVIGLMLIESISYLEAPVA